MTESFIEKNQKEKQALKQEGSTLILDVREKDEFAAEFIADSINLPLSQFSEKAPSLLKEILKNKEETKLNEEQNLLLMCLSGKRSLLAKESLIQLGFDKNLQIDIFEGGLKEWKRQGKPCLQIKKWHLPLMRQVQVFAGTMVWTSVLLTIFVNNQWLWLTGFVGVGLTFAGLTGFCGLMHLLKAMPWNKGCSL